MQQQGFPSVVLSMRVCCVQSPCPIYTADPLRLAARRRWPPPILPASGRGSVEDILGTKDLRCPGGEGSQKSEGRLSPPYVLSASSFRLLIAHLTPPMATEKMVAEYAKSGRSSCKGCGKNIPVRSLRLGLTGKDPRGFETVKWHHLDCVPTSRSFTSVEEIKGYYSLKVKTLGTRSSIRFADQICFSLSLAFLYPFDIQLEPIRAPIRRR